MWGATVYSRAVLDRELFQSTRPVWGATADEAMHFEMLRDFNPRAPCGARLSAARPALAESKFQSTRPVWGATIVALDKVAEMTISIHAPRVGRDRSRRGTATTRSYFNPRAPCGARRPPPPAPSPQSGFQSTRPVWGATSAGRGGREPLHRFQSTRPVWGATIKGEQNGSGMEFQSTRPVWGAT